ncbi:MAG: hypothetical protein ACO1SV_18750 [Fimbriimonas sp.]
MRGIERFERAVSFVQGVASLLWATWCYQRAIPIGKGLAIGFAFLVATTLVHSLPRLTVEVWRQRRHWCDYLLLIVLIGAVPGVLHSVMKYLGVSIEIQYGLLPAVVAVCAGLAIPLYRAQKRARELVGANPSEIPAATAHSRALPPVDTV